MRSLCSIGLSMPTLASSRDCRRAGDHVHDFLGSRLRDLTVADGAAPSQHPNTARDAKNLIEVVADDQYAHALPLELEDYVFNRLRFHDPKRRRWLVHENELRSPG